MHSGLGFSGLYSHLYCFVFSLVFPALMLTFQCGIQAFAESEPFPNKEFQKRLRTGGLHLTRSPYSFEIVLKSGDSASLDLTMSGIGTDWSKADCEAAVLSVYVDGVLDQDLVLWAGEQVHEYCLPLPDLKPAKHLITLEFAKQKSATGAKAIKIVNASLSPLKISDELSLAVQKYAPILFGRDKLANNHNDTPLALYYEISRNEDR